MTAPIDLLPQSYRRRGVLRRANRELAWMAVPVVLALVATDLLLRARVRGVERMAQQAREHALRGQHVAADTRALARRAAELQTSLEQASARLAAPRMTELLDGLLAGRPSGVRFHELLCVHDPWAPSDTPMIHLRASCSTATEFTQYLTALRLDEKLPPLACERSDLRGGSDEFGFQLETDAAAAAARRAAGGGQ